MLKSRKGISPILATLLLIVIAVAAIIITYAWVITYTTTVTGAENLGIMSIRRYKSKYYFIEVKNLGTVDATVVKVMIGGTLGSTGWMDVDSTLIKAGASAILDAKNMTYDFSVGQTVTVNVKTTLPSEFTNTLTVLGV